MWFYDVWERFGVSVYAMKEEGKAKPKLSRRRLIKLGAGALLAGGLVNGFALEPRRIRLERVRVRIDGLGAAFHGYKIGVLSDFHIPHFVSVDYIRRAFSLVTAEKPDLILLPGDFCNSKGFFGLDKEIPVPDLSPYFTDVAAHDGVFGVLGNHDYWLNAPGVIEQIARTPVRLIHNQSVVIERGGAKLAIVGTPDLWEADIDLNAAFAGIDDTTPRILLQHNPDLAEEFPEGYRVDLQISGHTHGGQVRIPFGPALILPTKYGNKYREGLVQGPRHRVYVTRGVGMSSTLPVRFCCPPEATLIELA
jgi:predicted MPP superfamily phosphohydrolase